MATSTAQAIATVPVWDYFLPPGDPTNTNPKALIGKRVKITLTYGLAQSANPVTLLGTDPVNLLTDANGFFQANLVPNNKISPAGTLYNVEIEGYRSYLINVTDVGVPAGGWQSSAIAVLPPVGGGAPGYTLPGGTQVLGELDVVSLDVAPPGVLPIGANNASSLKLGKAGVPTSADLLDWGGHAFHVKSAFNPNGPAACDHQAVMDASMGAASAVLTSPSGKFKASDVGKLAVVQAAGAGGTTLSTTIASFQSATQVTLAAPSTPAVANVEFDWGTDDTLPAQGSINAAAALIGGGTTGLFGSGASPAGVAVWPAPGLMVTASLVPKSGVTVDAYGATVWWGAPSGAQTSIIANPPPAIGANLNGFRIRGLTLDALAAAAVSGATLSSWQNGSISDMFFQRISGAAPCAALRLEASTGNSAYNNNALNTVSGVRFDQVNVMVQMSGKDANTVCTDNTFLGISGTNIFVGGFRHVQWNDSCTVVGSLVSLSSTGYGVKFNDSATPLADVGVYNHTYYGPSFDAFNGPGLGVGATYPIVFNWTKNNSFYGMFTGPTGTPGWTDLFLNTAAQSFRIEYDGQGLRGITGAQLGTFTLNEYRTMGNTTADSAPTNRGFLRMLGAQGGLAQDGGIEFESSAFGAGYGWRIGAPDNGGGDEPLIFMLRSSSASWTELLRFDSLASAVRFATAVSRIIPGATSMSMRNNANTADNWIIYDAGQVSARGQVYPGDVALTTQTTGGILHAVGVPANGNGNNNDWCISDNHHLYSKSGGVWVDMTATAFSLATPGNPAGTASTTGAMMGLAGSITPVRTGTIEVTISGDMANNTIADGVSAQIRTGTGTAPVNGNTTHPGTAVGAKPKVNVEPAAADVFPFSITVIVTGLTLGTAVWLDLEVAAITGGTASVSDITMAAKEI